MTKKTYWTDLMDRELADLEENALLRSVPPVDHGADRLLVHGGRQLLNLASNNYLGLAGRRELTDAACEAARVYGASAGASRLVSGNFAPYDELERAIARFKGRQDAVVLGSGYAANLAIMNAFADRRTIVLSDRLNHASIIDGIQLSRAKHVRYRHCDVDHLAELLRERRAAPRKIVVTDTVFSMDGDVAPLKRIAALCREHGALLVVDEAHGAGVLGQGKGLTHELGLTDEVDVHMGTFSKAFGSYGAYVAGSRRAVNMVRNKGRSFIFSTSLPPAAVGASLAALALAEAEPQAGARLLAMARDMRGYLGGLGLDTGPSQTQIIPVILGANETALTARDKLLERGLYVPAIRPPTVPEGTARLRLSLRADLTDEDLALIRTAFAELAGETRP